MNLVLPQFYLYQWNHPNKGQGINRWNFIPSHVKYLTQRQVIQHSSRNKPNGVSVEIDIPGFSRNVTWNLTQVPGCPDEGLVPWLVNIFTEEMINTGAIYSPHNEQNHCKKCIGRVTTQKRLLLHWTQTQEHFKRSLFTSLNFANWFVMLSRRCFRPTFPRDVSSAPPTTHFQSSYHSSRSIVDRGLNWSNT